MTGNSTTPTKRGRPSGVTAQITDQALQLLRAGFSGSSVADDLGLSKMQVSAIRKAHLPLESDRIRHAELDLLEARFWHSEVRIGSVNDCWPHITGTQSDYGRTNPRTAGTTMPFLTAYKLSRRANKSAGLVVRHLCDNKCCCNPSHLKLGTYGENQADRRNRRQLENQGLVGPTPVLNPVQPPPGGWVLPTKTIAELERLYDLDRLFWGAKMRGDSCVVYRTADLADVGDHRTFRLRGVGMSVGRASLILHKGIADTQQHLYVRHLCTIAGKHDAHGSCINPDHLQLGTQAENIADATLGGRRHSGEKHSRAALTNDQVRQLREKRWLQGAHLRDLGAEFGISQSQVSYLATHPDAYPEAGGPTGKPRRTLTEAQVAEARIAAASGAGYAGLAEKYGVALETMREAVTGKSWKGCPVAPVPAAIHGLTDADVRALRERAAEGAADEELALEFGTTREYAGSLRSGKARKSAGGATLRRLITDSDHVAIRQAYAAGTSRQEIAKTLGFSQNQVNDSIRGATGRTAGGPIAPNLGRGRWARKTA